MWNLYTRLENLNITIESYHKAEIEFDFKLLKKIRILPIGKQVCYQALINLYEQRKNMSNSQEIKSELNDIQKINQLQCELADLTACRMGLMAIVLCPNNNEKAELIFMEKAQLYGYFTKDRDRLIVELQEGERQTYIEIENLKKEIKKKEKEGATDSTSLQKWQSLFDNIVMLNKGGFNISIKSPMIEYISALKKAFEIAENERKELEKIKNKNG